MAFTKEAIQKAVKEAKFEGSAPKSFQSISTDTRTIKRGNLFIPLKGPNFNGKKFIKTALKKGATVLKVPYGLRALHQIAAYYRRQLDIPVIGITGSCGKTTTKEMVAYILSQKFKTLKSEENFNNEIGVPKTLLQLNKKHYAAVIEMAMQGFGEIAEIAEIASPTIAIITNVGAAHLKQLKSTYNVAKAKSEIIDYVRSGGYVILNADDEYFRYFINRVIERTNLLCCGNKGGCNCNTNDCGLRVISFGIKNKALISPDNRKIASLLKNLNLPGKHNIYNALAAIAAAKALRLSDNYIKAGLKKFKPLNHRMKILKSSGTTIIDDTYNANPSSMRAALKTLSSYNYRGRHLAILGDMLELGFKAKKYHQEIGEFAASLGVDIVIGVGKLAKHIASAAKKPGAITFHFKTAKLAIKKIKKLIEPGDTILVKGSRDMKLENIVEKI